MTQKQLRSYVYRKARHSGLNIPDAFQCVNTVTARLITFGKMLPRRRLAANDSTIKGIVEEEIQRIRNG